MEDPLEDGGGKDPGSESLIPLAEAAVRLARDTLISFTI